MSYKEAKHSEVQKKKTKSKKQNWEIYIVLSLSFGTGLLISRHSILGFIVAFLMSFVIYTLGYIYLTANRNKKKSKNERKQKNNYNHAAFTPSEEQEQYFAATNRKKEKSVKLANKNFNWTVDDIHREHGEKMKIQTEKKENMQETKSQKVPYRSPFEPNYPINELREKLFSRKTSAEMTNEISEPNDLDATLPERERGEGESQIFTVTSEENTAIDCPVTEEEVAVLDETASCSMPIFGPESITADVFATVTGEQKATEELDDYFDSKEERKVIKLFSRTKLKTAHKNEKSGEDTVAVRKISAGVRHASPSVDLLFHHNRCVVNEPEDKSEDDNGRKLIDTLASFGVGARIMNISRGPTVTRYEIQPNAGVKVSKIVNLSDDIALNLAAAGVRIEAPIPGKAAVGIEVPNKEVITVLLREVIESDEFKNHPSKISFAVGRDVAGKFVVSDIARMPHLLIAGATGSGKSVCINTLIASILYKSTPDEVRLLMVDPKVVELGIYNGIPHLLVPVVTDPKKASGALHWAVQEMTRRYQLFAENNVRDLRGYNLVMQEKQDGTTLPQIVIIIDELADLMMVAPNEVEDSICRLAQMARAAGMHLVIATQRPSVDVITGVIKANIPSRISFAVSSQIDSRTILDMAGAEKLLGRGDMLFNPLGEPKPIRVQGAFISDKEVEAIVSHLKADTTPEYDPEVLEKIESQTEASKGDPSDDDELLPQAIQMVLELGQASVSLIQRKFKVGYSRAARIVDQMEAWGVVGKADGSKPRQILITRQEWEELNS